MPIIGNIQALSGLELNSLNFTRIAKYNVQLLIYEAVSCYIEDRLFLGLRCHARFTQCLPKLKNGEFVLYFINFANLKQL